MRALGLEDGKRKTQGDVGKSRKPLGKVWTSLPVLVSETGGPIVGSEAFVGVGEDTVFIALTAISPDFLEMFPQIEGKKICCYGNLISSLPKLSPQGEIISEIPRMCDYRNLGPGLEIINRPSFPGRRVTIPFLHTVIHSLQH